MNGLVKYFLVLVVALGIYANAAIIAAGMLQLSLVGLYFVVGGLFVVAVVSTVWFVISWLNKMLLAGVAKEMEQVNSGKCSEEGSWISMG